MANFEIQYAKIIHILESQYKKTRQNIKEMHEDLNQIINGLCKENCIQCQGYLKNIENKIKRWKKPTFLVSRNQMVL